MQNRFRFRFGFRFQKYLIVLFFFNKVSKIKELVSETKNIFEIFLVSEMNSLILLPLLKKNETTKFSWKRKPKRKRKRFCIENSLLVVLLPRPFGS